MKKIFSLGFYRVIGAITIVSVFILIFLGGLVRITGSGMGCPDWPLCFGKVIPPTCECELPADYQTKFSEPGKPVEKFNAVHTWIEWINRDAGAITGVFILLLLISSIQFIKSDKKIFLLTLGAFILTMVQAWVGAKVVRSNLHGGMISIHLILAFVIMGLIMLAVFFKRQNREVLHLPILFKVLISASLLITVYQVVIGAQVREMVSEMVKQNRQQDWVTVLGGMFTSHANLAIVVFLTHAITIYLCWKRHLAHTTLFRALLVAMFFVIVQIITGSINIFADFPPASQLAHITQASALFICDFYCCILVFNNKTNHA